MALNVNLENYYSEEIKLIRSRIDQEITSMNSNEALSITYIGAIYLVYFQFKISNHGFLVLLSLLPIVIAVYGLLRYNSQRRVIHLHENYQKNIEGEIAAAHADFVGMVTYYDKEKDVYRSGRERFFAVKLKYARWVLWGSLIVFTVIFAAGAVFNPRWLGSVHSVEAGKS